MELLVAVMLGALLGMLGPFDTYRMGTGIRSTYWIFVMAAGLAIGRPTLIVSEWLAAETGLPVLAVRSVAIAIGSLPMTLLVTWLITGFDLARASRFPGMPVIYGQVLLISILTYGVYHFTFRSGAVMSPELQKPAATEAPAGIERAASPFYARLPTGFAPLLANPDATTAERPSDSRSR